MDRGHSSQREDAENRDDSSLDSFVRNLTESQRSLNAFLVASLGNYDDAQEVLQQTNLALWRKAREFRPDAEFMPWAVAVARYEVLTFYRDRSRDRHVFSEELAISMLETTEEMLPDLNLRHDALRKCIVALPAASRDMIRRRYEDGATLMQISEQLNRTENAVKFALARIRKNLAKCIRKRISLGN